MQSESLAQVRDVFCFACSSYIIAIARQLSKKANIPAIPRKMETTKHLQRNLFWGGTAVLNLEYVSEQLKDLMKFMDRQKDAIYYANFEDRFEANIKEH